MIARGADGIHRSIIGRAGPGDDAVGRFVDVRHQPHLRRTFRNAALVDADGVDPDEPLVRHVGPGGSEPLQHVEKIGPDWEPGPVAAYCPGGLEIRLLTRRPRTRVDIRTSRVAPGVRQRVERWRVVKFNS